MLVCMLMNKAGGGRRLDIFAQTFFIYILAQLNFSLKQKNGTLKGTHF